MNALENLTSAVNRQNPFVVKSKRLKREAEKDTDNELLYFYIGIYIDDDNKSGKNFLGYADIDYVEYELHETFPDRYRLAKSRANKFEIQIWTYGFFRVKAKLFTRWGQIVEAMGKIEFDVSPEEKANNRGELEW